VLRYYGIEGLRYHVRQHIALAQNFAAQIRQAEKFELVAPAPLNLVCFRHVNGDAFNRQLLERLNASGRVYLTHTILNGQYALRLCVGQTNTQERHVAEAWRLIQQAAQELENEK